MIEIKSEVSHCPIDVKGAEIFFSRDFFPGAFFISKWCRNSERSFLLLSWDYDRIPQSIKTCLLKQFACPIALKTPVIDGEGFTMETNVKPKLVVAKILRDIS